MATKKKMLQAAAGNAGGGGPLNVEDVFSTYLYTGNGSTQTITNGIDLDGEGGLVWVKSRGFTRNHVLVDTERGVRRNLRSNTTAAEGSVSGDNVNAFYSDGFLAGPSGEVNASSEDYASWTFRKAPKFFDVVTWTGTGSNQTISHSLDADIGFMVVKETGGSSDWNAFHRVMGNPNNYTQPYLRFNDTFPVTSLGEAPGGSIAMTSSGFTATTLINGSGKSYVAYLFAHNNGDGEFGPDGDQDIIKCKSYTGNGDYLNGKYVDVGFEPQWILQKSASTTGPWLLLDIMRGWDVNTGNKPRLLANATNTEANADSSFALVSGSGFTIYDTSSKINGNGQEYIYIAIRRGTKVPESATEVFDVNLQNGGGAYTATTGFPVDLTIQASRSSTIVHRPYDRLRGGSKYLETSSSDVEQSGGSAGFDNNTGYTSNTSLDTVDWLWKRAPGFFDAVAYKGTGSGTQVLNHNLGVTPELVIQKGRSIGLNWTVAAKITGTTFRKGQLNSNSSLQLITYASDQRYFTNFSDTSITVGNDLNSNDTHIMYLFATLDGISKVGTFSTNYSDLVVDCGFTTGARFVLFKRVPTGSANWDGWFIFDAERGITTSADPFLKLDTTSAEDTDGNNIESHSSGFKVKSGGGLNFANGQEIVFYAIA